MQNQQAYDLAGRKLFIALPAYDFKVSVKLAVSLVDLCTKLPSHGVNVQIANICGCSVVSRARNLLADEFLKSDATDLMFIDSDINFNADDVIRLLAWGTDPKKGIVAGIPVARKKNKVYISILDTDDDSQVTMNAMGLVRAKRVATAFMLVQRKVFEDLRDAHPEWKHGQTEGDPIYSFFDFKSTPEGYIGEDFLFCDRARELGYEVWIDPTIELGHMGMQEFKGSFGEDWLYPQLKPQTLSTAA